MDFRTLNGYSVKDEAARQQIQNQAAEIQNQAEQIQNQAEQIQNQAAQIAAVSGGVAKFAVTPQMFGAIGDGLTDDSEAIQSAFDSGLTVVFPAGKYKFHGITCDHSVNVFFENAEIIPDFYEGTNGVLKNLFTFTGCKKVTIKGLKIIVDPVTMARANNQLTESIAEFNGCTEVLISEWNVQNLNYWNRGNSPAEPYDRKAIIITAIDSGVVVENCDFGNLSHEEWTWITYKDNLIGAKATFRNCRFHSSANGLSCVGILAHTANVIDCVFENITYTGSLANLLSLYGNFSDNIIVNCDVDSVCDFREGVWVFSSYAKIHNNRMINSKCYKFAPVSGKDVHITNNIVTANVFCYCHNPLEKNILRENTEVKKIRYVIENNVAEAVDTGVVNADDSFLFFRFSNFVEGVWNSADSEIMCRNNRFISNNKGIKNPNFTAVDAGKIVMHENVLYLGNRSATGESGYAALYIANTNTSETVIDFVGNKIEMNTTAETASNPAVVVLTASYESVKMNAFYNAVRNAVVLPHLAYAYTAEAMHLDSQANINFADANNANTFIYELPAESSATE